MGKGEPPERRGGMDRLVGKWHGEFPRRNETIKRVAPAGSIKNLIGLTRLIDVRAKLAEANREMAVGAAEREL